jgi:hypothetical protein
MRHRLEDLGRLSVLLRNLIDHELFNDDGGLRPRRPKDYDEWFASKSEDQKDDLLRAWAYGLEGINNQLYDMLSIAEGTDLLNEKSHE